MVKILTEKGWKTHQKFPGDPIFHWVRKHHIASQRQERVKRIWPTFPPITHHSFKGFDYRIAHMYDLESIVEFVDRLLAGKDFFCPRGQHIGYFKYKTILVCFAETRLIGWAVRQKNGSLIHLLVEPDYRGKGIGGHMLEVLEPLLIRSKFDQSTGDPIAFYEKHGYYKTTEERVGKNKNIDLLSRPVKTSQ